MVSSGDPDVTTERLEQTQVDVHVAAGSAEPTGTMLTKRAALRSPLSCAASFPKAASSRRAREPAHDLAPRRVGAGTRVFLRTAETAAQGAASCARSTPEASIFEVDAQGRLLLTAPQRAFAQIVDQVVFVGIGTGVESIADAIWKAEAIEPITPDEFTQFWDVVHQRGTSASSSPA